MPTAEDVKQTLLAEMPEAEVSVTDTTGGGDHFDIEIVSTQFEGMPRIAQHRLVHESLGEQLGNGSIHAVAIKTRVPEEK